mmetsp:Transcript_39916/g.59218  ORF Transcript_39916/g.59218 Transcript_39916/m.59218 type:complete len:177 (-) Transcript_39916:100-630(-)
MMLFQAKDSIPWDLVDCIGKIPDVGGLMRVIACVYNRGWDPAAIIVINAARTGSYSVIAGLLQASYLNVVNFEPRSFWKTLERDGDVEGALKWSITPDKSPPPRVNNLTVGNITPKMCNITPALLHALPELKYNSIHSGVEEDLITQALTYSMAKCIADRADFKGSDVEFIDRDIM